MRVPFRKKPPNPEPLLRLKRKRSQKAGLPPGSLVHIGRPSDEPVEISIFDYDAERVDEFSCQDAEICLAYRGTIGTGTWINVDSVSDTVLVSQLCDALGVHPLVQEDLVNTEQRPKLEEYEGYLFLVLKMIHLQAASLVVEQVSFIVRPDLVLSFQEQDYPGDVFDPVRERLRQGKGKIRTLGNDYLAHALVDVVVDSYFGVIEQLGDQIEKIEEEVMHDPEPDVLHRINALRRQVIYLRKAIWPLRDMMNQLARIENPIISERTRLYFRDIHDHVIQVVEMIETFRDLLAGMHDLYLSSVSHRTNEVMKFLTIVGTIFIPLTFIAGVYGMNFDYMPELHYKWSYPILWLIMLAVAAGLIFYFRKKRWL